MRNSILIVASLLALSGAATMQGRFGSTADEAAILKQIDARAVAFNKHDAKAVAALYAADADRVTARGYFVGRRQIEKSYADGFATVNKGAVLTEGSNRVRFLADGVAVRDGDVTISGTTTGTVKNRVTDIFVKRNGQWALLVSRTVPTQ